MRIGPERALFFIRRKTEDRRLVKEDPILVGGRGGLDFKISLLGKGGSDFKVPLLGGVRGGLSE